MPQPSSRRTCRVCISAVWLLLVIGATLPCPAAAEDGAKHTALPFVTVPWVRTAPAIDGVIGKDEYAVSSSLFPFRMASDGKLTRNQTLAFIASDDKHLYVAWRCAYRGDKPSANAEARDDSVWDDDAIEVFLFLSPTTPKPLYHFIGNSKGVFYDELDGRADWDGEWIYRTRIEPHYWYGELAVPYKTLGLAGAPADGTVWGFQLGREPEISLWSYRPGGGFYHGGGKIIFDRKGVGVRVEEFPAVVGENRLKVKLAFPDGAATVQRLNLNIDGGVDTVKTTKDVEPRAGKVVAGEMAYALKAKGPRVLSLSVADAGTGKQGISFCARAS